MIIILFFLLIINPQMTGLATHYGHGFDNNRYGASGIICNSDDPIAAHKTLPYGTIIRVINNDPKNPNYNKSATVIIFDRGPYSNNAILDLQPHTMWDLAGKKCGGLNVRIKIVSKKYACDDYFCLRKKLGVKRITDEKLLDLLMGE